MLGLKWYKDRCKTCSWHTQRPKKKGKRGRKAVICVHPAAHLLLLLVKVCVSYFLGLLKSVAPQKGLECY